MGGDRLGRYVVLRHLASGGMADVLLARTDGIEGFARHVVLKRIKPEHARDQRFMAMFLDEARLAANLHHGNIVQVFDIGESGGEYFFAMEYLHGEDLRAILSTVAKQRTHVPLGHVIGIVAAAAAGLHHAHERRGPDKKPLGIVHRDVSPSNILIGYDGTPKLVDFGIAKAAARQLETHSGTLKGKVAYMSPEQCKSLPVDRRSDVYALGVVLYELATTTRLFKGESDYLVMDAICTGKIPLPRIRRPELPNELSVIIMKALAVDPARRYQTADELRVALEQFGTAFGLSASTSGLADYMHKLFGDKPEPWLDDRTLDEGAPAEPLTSASRPTELGRRAASIGSGEDMATVEDAPKTITNGELQPVRSAAPTHPPALGASGSMPSMGSISALSAPAAPSVPFAIDGSHTSTKLAWEPAGAAVPSLRSWSGGKLAAVVAAVAVVVAIGAWRLSSDGDPARPAVAIMPAETPPTSTPIAAPIAPVAAAVATPAPAREVTVKHAVPPPTPAPAKKVVAAPPTPAPVVAETPVAAPVAPVVVPAPEPPPPPAPAPVIEPVIAHLSDATVQAVARDHARELSSCESSDLHGEITVRFQIDGAGHVTKKQLSSTLGKPKVAGCILTTLARWQFPKPPTGAADGTYTVSFQ